VGPGPHHVLDCAVGIGTQSLGLAGHRHTLTGSDISPGAVRRARAEFTARGLTAGLAVADMRRLPFADDRFDVVVCADNSLPHLLTGDDVVAALSEMRRVAGPDGLVIVTTRDYDEVLAQRPNSTQPQVYAGPEGLTVTFQVWEWAADDERYDLRLFQVSGDVGSWQVAHHRATYWALSRQRLMGYAQHAGLLDTEWRMPARTGFFQQMLLARVPC
jgi:glycine/sarcosine N-methyltransferase